MQLRRMADASLALAERRAGDLKDAVERLGLRGDVAGRLAAAPLQLEDLGSRGEPAEEALYLEPAVAAADDAAHLEWTSLQVTRPVHALELLALRMQAL